MSKFKTKEIARRPCRSSKTAIFAIFGALNFIVLVNFSLHKLQKLHNYQNSDSLNYIFCSQNQKLKTNLPKK